MVHAWCCCCFFFYTQKKKKRLIDLNYLMMTEFIVSVCAALCMYIHTFTALTHFRSIFIFFMGEGYLRLTHSFSARYDGTHNVSWWSQGKHISTNSSRARQGPLNRGRERWWLMTSSSLLNRHKFATLLGVGRSRMQNDQNGNLQLNDLYGNWMLSLLIMFSYCYM